MAVEVLSTWPEPTLLAGLRRALTDADEALICVAFTNQKGVHLLEPELQALGDRCRVLATTVFADPAPALGQLTRWGNEVRVLNPGAGTYHPQPYLAAHGADSRAFIGSANLTSGLLTNVELGVALAGPRAIGPLADAWRIGEAYWGHPTSVPWTPTAPATTEAMSSVLLAAIGTAIGEGATIPTVSDGRPNTIAQITELGVYVITERSGTTPQLVDAWMIELAAEVLLADGLTNTHLLNDLHVHRSSAVCAILAQLPEVVVESRRPIRLELRAQPAWGARFLEDVRR